MLKRLVRLPALQGSLATVLGLYLAVALRTTRWRLEGGEHVAPFAEGRPCVAAFWHERLPLMPALWLRIRGSDGRAGAPLHVLVSRHHDGRFIGAVLRPFGIGTVLGSTSRGGAAGLRALLAWTASGGQVGITPDGPRGPRRRAAPGVAQLAALAGVPVLPCAAQTSRGWALNSWDRMVIPMPFGRGVLVVEPPITVARTGWEASLPVIEAALSRAADRADQLCAA